ncbi:MAG: serine hydrolase [Deltaproteobacteria bacterium]|nr:serine hydrolase [Deltaproteobacteria bacterium]
MHNVISFMARIFLGLIILGLSSYLWAGETFPGEKWGKVISPDAAGWSSERLKNADDFARTLKTDAYLIVHHGVIVHEYGATTRAINIHSIRKSVLSVLMGIYSDRGVVVLNKTLSDLDINDKERLSATERQATVQQLMQARSGIYHPAAYEVPEAAVARPTRGTFKPGEHWYYNNWDFNALGTIFQKFTGKTVFESLRDDLAQPLQFEDFSYSSDTHFQYESASEHPAYIMCLSARDLARLGLLMSRNGRWKDRQIVSEKWVVESTTSYSETDIPERGYGYLWWVNVRQKSYSANGYKGQVMIVNPVRDLIIVHQVDTENDPNKNVSGGQFSELLQRIINAKLTEG